MGFSKFIVIALLATTLLTSVESRDDCPNDIFKGPQKRFNIILKDKVATKSHFKWLTNCYGRKIKHTSSVDFSKKLNKNDVLDFSVENVFHGYSADFHPEFVKHHLSNFPGIEVAEEDTEVKINYVVPRAVQSNPNPNLDRIDQEKFPLDEKYNFPDNAGKGVNVYIVDTGIRISHNEFEGRASFGYSSCFGCLNTDDHGHGTHVAAIVAGKTFGVSKKSNLIAVKVLNAAGSGSNSEVICGLSFVLNDHIKNKKQNSVVNMSLGGGFSQATNDAVKALTNNGIHVVVAAGNSAEDACEVSPASERTAITVGATEDSNDNVTNFSNIGRCVDIFAPGRNILSAGILTDDDNKVFSGTSQASPHVAGTVALIIAESGNFEPAKMVKKLVKIATKKVIPPKTLKGSPNVFVKIPM
ncbi:4256_t:CDS:2 [Funneliformis geosporum]|uniref:14600_t:CDS:1 n=1 Tax=Funneliformis geosporum TaxID=1117311 RepID=A0A9W4T5R5_9GLOM|nr:14600_t:CDS:2 [Funneliformis geosporum]CAI2191934.1 4256_t:CDS:2 [Funneliformis geosporum]